MDMKHGVLAVDPGKTTGVALITWTGERTEFPKVHSSSELSELEFADYIIEQLRNADLYENFTVACERFTITVQTAKNSQAPYSLEQIGVLKYLCRVHNYPPEKIRFQMPADAKAIFSNEKLKQIGTWHKGGAGHANDAIRHGLLALARYSWVTAPDAVAAHKARAILAE